MKHFLQNQGLHSFLLTMVCLGLFSISDAYGDTARTTNNGNPKNSLARGTGESGSMSNERAIKVETQRRTGYRNGERNPFAITNRLQRVKKRDPNELQFQPARIGSRIPKMKLRGIIRRKGKRLAALLEIEGAGTHVVREKDAVGLNELGKDMVIRIKKINRLNLVVEVGSLNRLMIVR